MPNDKTVRKPELAICIGVKKYNLTLNKPCAHNGKIPIQAELSFDLWGNFLPAALADDFKYTIDYSQICQLISETITQYDCSSLQNLSKALRAKLIPYLYLVYQGNLSISIKCHDTTFIALNFPFKNIKGLNQWNNIISIV
jgi:hypothetical protein